MSHYFVSKSSAAGHLVATVCNRLQPNPAAYLFDTHCSYSDNPKMLNDLRKSFCFNNMERFRPHVNAVVDYYNGVLFCTVFVRQRI